VVSNASVSDSPFSRSMSVSAPLSKPLRHPTIVTTGPRKFFRSRNCARASSRRAPRAKNLDSVDIFQLQKRDAYKKHYPTIFQCARPKALHVKPVNFENRSLQNIFANRKYSAPGRTNLDDGMTRIRFKGSFRNGTSQPVSAPPGNGLTLRCGSARGKRMAQSWRGWRNPKTWMPGSSPGMTTLGYFARSAESLPVRQNLNRTALGHLRR
jgi:hypothetical protein